jgi:ABC-type uncharacterized transport system permease subunit
VNTVIFAVCFGLGSAAVAIWAHVRFPGLMPASIRTTLLHVAGTVVAVHLLTPLGMHSLTSSPVLALVALFVVAFPALTYSLLVGIWLVKLAQDLRRGIFR